MDGPWGRRAYIVMMCSTHEHSLKTNPSFVVVVQSVSCLTLWDSMDCSTPGLPVPHYLPEFAQVHVHWVEDVIQPPHPLLPSSPFAFCFPQHQHFFQWVGSLHQVTKVLELQHQFFQWILRVDFLWGWLVWPPCSPRTLKSLLWHHSSFLTPSLHCGSSAEILGFLLLHLLCCPEWELSHSHPSQASSSSSGGNTMTEATGSLSFKTGNGGRNLIEHLLCDRHWARHLTYDITSDMQPFCKVWV